MKETSLKTVISGSYRKHLAQLYELKQNLENLGIVVLSPVGSLALNPGEEFVFLDEDPILDKRLLQDSIFAKIRCSSFLVLANYQGYIGRAAAIEIGYAIAFGIQILSWEPIDDPNIKPYSRPILDVFPKLQSIKQDVLCHS